MSHFTVLVIGENPEGQLAPFQENNMGDAPKELLKFRYEGEYYDSVEAAKDGNPEDFDEQEGYWDNPNAKWDWYSLGGRWAGFFTLKPTGKGTQGHHRAKDFALIDGTLVEDLPETVCDQAQKKDIDFDAMRKEAEDRAAKEFDYAQKFLSGLPIARAWKDIGKQMNYSDEAREIYRNQPAVIAYREAEEKNREDWPFGWMGKVEDLQIPRAEYIANARNGAVSTHAVIKDGNWYERGEMGWWAIVSNEKDNWDKEFSKLLDSVSDDTLLSVYDCHI